MRQQFLIVNIGNKGLLEGLLTSILSLAEDVTDPSNEKAAFTFLARCVSAWGQPAQPAVPGFERFIYERLVPIAFAVIAMPGFNVKDGQTVVVSGVGWVVVNVISEPTCRFSRRLPTFFRP